MALVALAILGIVAMAGLSIDVGTLYEAKAEAQRSADSAALAAARVLSFRGITGDPTKGSTTWERNLCSGHPAARRSRVNEPIGGTAPRNQHMSTSHFSNGANSASGRAFGVNPVVTVHVTQR